MIKLGIAVPSMLPAQRTALAKEMIRRDCTHILRLDTDMKFPADAARRLLAHDKDIVRAAGAFAASAGRRRRRAEPPTLALANADSSPAMTRAS